MCKQGRLRQDCVWAGSSEPSLLTYANKYQNLMTHIPKINESIFFKHFLTACESFKLKLQISFWKVGLSLEEKLSINMHALYFKTLQDKKVSEYVQEIPQSHTADQPTAP